MLAEHRTAAWRLRGVIQVVEPDLGAEEADGAAVAFEKAAFSVGQDETVRKRLKDALPPTRLGIRRLSHAYDSSLAPRVNAQILVKTDQGWVDPRPGRSGTA